MEVAGKRMLLGLVVGCGGEGTCWEARDTLAHNLILVPVSAVVGTLGSSGSPEKNASQSQQLFLPGRQLPWVVLLVCLLFSRKLLAPVSFYSPGNSEPPLLWLLSPTLLLVPFPAQEGPGLSMVALEVHCAQVRCLVSPSRVACWPPGEGQASLLFHGSSVSPWSFHIGDQVWPLIIHGSWRHILGTEGLAGLPKQPADLCFPYPSCL